MLFSLTLSSLSAQSLHISIHAHAEINQMANYLTFEKVMEEINVDDSDQGDSDDDLIPDELDDNYSRQQDEEDPLDRIVESQEDDMPDADESICEQSSQTSNETAVFHPSGSDVFLPVPGRRRSVLVDLNAESQPYDFFCKIWGEDTFSLLTDQTNLYATQKGTESWKDRKLEGHKCRGNAVLCWHTIGNRNGATTINLRLLEHQSYSQCTCDCQRDGVKQIPLYPQPSASQ